MHRKLQGESALINYKNEHLQSRRVETKTNLCRALSETLKACRQSNRVKYAARRETPPEGSGFAACRARPPRREVGAATLSLAKTSWRRR